MTLWVPMSWIGTGFPGTGTLRDQRARKSSEELQHLEMRRRKGGQRRSRKPGHCAILWTHQTTMKGQQSTVWKWQWPEPHLMGHHRHLSGGTEERDGRRPQDGFPSCGRMSACVPSTPGSMSGNSAQSPHQHTAKPLSLSGWFWWAWPGSAEVETCVLNHRVMEKGRGAGRAGRWASVVSDGEESPCVQHRRTGACRSETDDGEHSIRAAVFQRSEEHP